MKNLYGLLLILVISILLPGAVLAVEPAIAGFPDLQWGMTPTQVQALAPGTFAGRLLLYQTEFFTYPAIGQYFFNNQDQLTYTSFVPQYTYDERAQWNQEFEHLKAELTKIYGKPAATQAQQCQWKTPLTQTLLILHPNGWLVRFDRVTP
jgi:hypothetical protein